MTRWELDCAGFFGLWRRLFEKAFMRWMLLIVALGLLLFWNASFYQGCSQDSSCGALLSHQVTNALLREGEHAHNKASLHNAQEARLQEERKKAVYKDSSNAIGTNRLSVVEAAVAFNESILLLLNPPYTGLRDAFHRHPTQLTCIFARGVQTNVVSVEDGMIQCNHPPNALRKSLTGSFVTLKLDRYIFHASVFYGKVWWKKLVYDVSHLEDEGELLLYVKGLSHSKRSLLPDGLECQYGDNVRTQVVAFCQENVRCKLPPRHSQHEVDGLQVTLVLRDTIFPSVVKFSLGPTHLGTHTGTTEEAQRPYFLCVCTLVWNGAKFLKEWIMYHSYLGVQRFFLYDNNSDDDIESVLESLHSYNVSRHPWPWQKTQEAGFSHCAVKASSQCMWMAFIDLDEFIFPKSFLPSKERKVIEAPLHGLIKEYDRVDRGKLGQLKFSNFNFGPSGLSTLPKSGQMVNYICRMSVPKRVKSIVRASAIHPSYCSRVHYFELKAGYVAAQAVRKDAIIHHYKFHVWEDFKLKFVRRAATFVTDWGQNKDLDSFDRTPGLGTQAVEPIDWAHQFCEIEDTSLRDFIMKTSHLHFAGKLLWE